ncbi:hypothetical protein CspeluHIS016_0104800 [Cutaneotrichosporon spelunceum]|uniref:Uncharacterized protein n=1 Tax=Cutaneotrichosporon spelunceum TaxID=1672016 RepID=A0AAD3TNU0_9TREE|nr:hypothetical protein CspeluHIS016_0104800 [Cutaneotrichosporon spelunceum]
MASRQKIAAAFVTQRTSSPGPSQLDPVNEPCFPSSPATQAPISIAFNEPLVIPPPENTKGSDPDLHMAQSSQVVLKHPPPRKSHTLKRAPLDPALVKSDNTPTSKERVPSLEPPISFPKKQSLVTEENSHRGKRSKVEATIYANATTKTAGDDQITFAEQGPGLTVPKTPVKRPPVSKAVAIPSGEPSASRKATTISAKSVLLAACEEVFQSETSDPLPSSPLRFPWETQDYVTASVTSKKGSKLVKTEPNIGTKVAMKLSKTHTTEYQSKRVVTKSDTDNMSDARVLADDPADSTPPSAGRLSNASNPSLRTGSKLSPKVVHTDDPTSPETSESSTSVFSVALSASEASTEANTGTAGTEGTVNGPIHDNERATRLGKRKAEAAIDFTHNITPQRDSGASDTGTCRRIMNLTASSPLLVPTSPPTDTQAKSNMASSSFDSLDSITGVGTPSAQADRLKQNLVGAVDAFGDAPAAGSVRAAGENASEGRMYTNVRAATIKRKPFLRSPPLPNHEDRPSKRIRFDIPRSAEQAYEPRTSAFGMRKSSRGSLKPTVVPKENRKLNEVHSLFAEFYDPIVRSFSNKVEAPSRAMQKARRQIELSARETICKWMDEGNPNLIGLSAAYEQRSMLFNDHMRAVFQAAKNESNKRHKRVQSLCAEGRKKPVYSTSY